MKIFITCRNCPKQLTGKQTMYCSGQCKNKSHQSYPSQKRRGVSRKLEIINKLGGKCSHCNYNKNLAALTFHHSDPKLKEFKLDVRSLSNRKIEKVLVEIDKCVLLCHNCHSELHNPDLDLAKLSLSRLL